MSRKAKMTYDPETGKWSRSTKSSDKESTKTPKKKTTLKKKTPKKSNKGKLTSKSTDKKSGTGKTEKKYNYRQINILVGTLNYIANENTIRLQAGDTVKLQGLGKYLSGSYYVKDVTRQISSSGYTHSATVIKTDMGSSLKLTTKSKDKGAETKKEKSPSNKKSNTRKYTVKKGDTVYSVAKKFYGKGSNYKKIYDQKTGKVVNPKTKLRKGQVLILK